MNLPYKIGSGDITWKEILIKIAKKLKPVILASGASTIKETIDATRLLLKYNKNNFSNVTLTIQIVQIIIIILIFWH